MLPGDLPGSLYDVATSLSVAAFFAAFLVASQLLNDAFGEFRDAGTLAQRHHRQADSETRFERDHQFDSHQRVQTHVVERAVGIDLVRGDAQDFSDLGLEEADEGGQ